MQSSQQGFNIKWQHVSTTHPKSLKLVQTLKIPSNKIQIETC